MSSVVPKMFADDDVSKEQMEFGNCCEEQRDNEDDVGTEEELIDLVKASPILYDVRMKDIYFAVGLFYEPIGSFERLLTEFPQDEGGRPSFHVALPVCGVMECKNKWKNIRDAYVKYLHSFKDENSMSGRKTKKRYKFADKMDFLDKCIQHRNSPGNPRRQKGDSILNQNTLSMVVSYPEEHRDRTEEIHPLLSPEPVNLNNQHLLNSTSSAEKSNPTQPKISRLKQDSNVAKNDRKRKLEVDRFDELAQLAANVDDQDDSKLFCLSLISTLKRLSPRKRQLAKLKIQNVLYEIEFSGDS
eukprot:gene213-829_t